MSGQTNSIPALIAELDTLLQRSQPSWQTAELMAQQRHLLERIRPVLSQWSAAPPEVDAIAMLRAVVQEVEQLRTSMVQPLHTELEYLRRQREQLLQEIQQLEVQRQAQPPLPPANYAAEINTSLQEMVNTVKTTIQQHRAAILQEVNQLQLQKPQTPSVNESSTEASADHAQPAEPPPLVSSLSSAALSQPAPPTVPVPQRSIAPEPIRTVLEQQARPSDKTEANPALFPYAGVEVQEKQATHPANTTEPEPDNLTPLLPSLEQAIDSWWLATSGIGNLTRTELDLLEAEYDLELELDDQDWASMDAFEAEIDDYLEQKVESEQERVPRLVQRLDSFSADDATDPIQGWEINEPVSAIDEIQPPLSTQPASNHPVETQDAVQQIQALTDLLSETKPALAQEVSIFGFDDSMGSLFIDTPDVIAVKAIEPPLADPQGYNNLPLGDMSALFVDKPPLATPAPPPSLGSEPKPLHRAEATPDPPTASIKNPAGTGYPANYGNATDLAIDNRNYTDVEISAINMQRPSATAAPSTVDVPQLNQAFESLVGPIGGVSLPPENSRQA